MRNVSQKELRETFEDHDDCELFYEPYRYSGSQALGNDVSVGVCYEDLLPARVLDIRRKRIRRCA